MDAVWKSLQRDGNLILGESGRSSVSMPEQARTDNHIEATNTKDTKERKSIMREALLFLLGEEKLIAP